MNTAKMITTYDSSFFWKQGSGAFFCQDKKIQTLVDLVAISFNVPVIEIFRCYEATGRLSRKEEFVLCRQIIHYVAVMKIGYGKSEIGRITDVCHSTVIHSIESITAIIENEYSSNRERKIKSNIETIVAYCICDRNSNNIAQL
jgi:chromosomal replication initiation ATPase DnaA